MIQHPFMDIQIPDLGLFRDNKSNYRNYPLKPVKEECLRVNHGLLCRSYYWHFDPRPEGATEAIFLRKSIAEKLYKIDQKLYPVGLRLLIQEGYRPISVQNFVKEVSVLKGLRKEYPLLTELELKEKVKMFAACVDDDPVSFPTPHLTGGAVDLTLVYSSSGEQVNMGKSAGLYNTAFPDSLEREDLSEKLENAKRFRRLLFWLACEQQMVVNPTEWWHLSWGDQMWAWATGAPYAVYGVASLPNG